MRSPSGSPGKEKGPGAFPLVPFYVRLRVASRMGSGTPGTGSPGCTLREGGFSFGIPGGCPPDL